MKDKRPNVKDKKNKTNDHKDPCATHDSWHMRNDCGEIFCLFRFASCNGSSSGNTSFKRKWILTITVARLNWTTDHLRTKYSIKTFVEIFFLNELMVAVSEMVESPITIDKHLKGFHMFVRWIRKAVLFLSVARYSWSIDK